MRLSVRFTGNVAVASELKFTDKASLTETLTPSVTTELNVTFKLSPVFMFTVFVIPSERVMGRISVGLMKKEGEMDDVIVHDELSVIGTV